MSTLAWHFVRDTLRDGRPVPADGEWLVHTGEVAMCESGLHASLDPFDALTYAPGDILCRVDCDDVVVHEHDKLVSRRRMIVRRIDATELLRSYARWCALSVIHMWDAPAVVHEYLETGDKRKMDAARNAAGAAARNAAGAAARDAARGAAMDAARNATRNAAGTAAWDAARGAARGAARNAARNAAWTAAWDAAKDAAWTAARNAARNAAWDAAWDAARATQRAEFNRCVQEAFR